jgi:RimJ/RimL family protein N-acetyltransferase
VPLAEVVAGPDPGVAAAQADGEPGITFEADASRLPAQRHQREHPPGHLQYRHLAAVPARYATWPGVYIRGLRSIKRDESCRQLDPAMQVFLETERLVLRRFTTADVDNLVSLDADPDVMRFVTGGKPTSREEIENEFLPAFLGYYQRYQEFGFWAAIERYSGEFLGWFHFRPRDPTAPEQAELGYRLRKSAWGKGYATEGSRALIRKGFRESGVQLVTAEAVAANMASRRVMEKAGLTLVRTSHQPWPGAVGSDELEVVEYALRKADWEQQDQGGANAAAEHKYPPNRPGHAAC